MCNAGHTVRGPVPVWWPTPTQALPNIPCHCTAVVHIMQSYRHGGCTGLVSNILVILISGRQGATAHRGLKRRVGRWGCTGRVTARALGLPRRRQDRLLRHYHARFSCLCAFGSQVRALRAVRVLVLVPAAQIDFVAELALRLLEDTTSRWQVRWLLKCSSEYTGYITKLLCCARCRTRCSRQPGRLHSSASRGA